MSKALGSESWTQGPASAEDINKDYQDSPGWVAGDKRRERTMAEERSEREIQPTTDWGPVLRIYDSVC